MRFGILWFCVFVELLALVARLEISNKCIVQVKSDLKYEEDTHLQIRGVYLVPTRRI